MIEVDRAKGGTALRDMVHRGREEAAKGRQIVIFPEGTRRPPGAEPAYQPGIALLYKGLGLPTVPVALNSGLYWPRRSFLKYPGTIVIEFLPPIEPGLDSRHIPCPAGNSDRSRLRPAACRGGGLTPAAAAAAPGQGAARRHRRWLARALSRFPTILTRRKQRVRDLLEDRIAEAEAPQMAHRVDDIVGIGTGVAMAVADVEKDRLGRQGARHTGGASRSTT